MNCAFCENPATAQCRRCGRVHCDEHGDGLLCEACLDPASAVPSPLLFRGALLALLIGTVLAVWLLVRPPGSSSSAQDDQAAVVTASPPPSATEAPTDAPTESATPRSTRTATAAASETPGTGTPEESPTSTPTPRKTKTPKPGVTEYTVKEGDTLFDIATQFGVTVEAIMAANNLTDTNLLIGQKLKIPPPPAETPTPATLLPRRDASSTV